MHLAVGGGKSDVHTVAVDPIQRVVLLEAFDRCGIRHFRAVHPLRGQDPNGCGEPQE